MLTKKLGRGDQITLGVDGVVVQDIFSRETAGGNEEGRKVGEFRSGAAYSEQLTVGRYVRQILDLKGAVVYADVSKTHEFEPAERLKVKEVLGLPRMGHVFFRDKED